VNAVGIDRPGIISDISKIVTDANGNVGESRALKLGEHFAVMMLIDLQDEGNDEGTVQKMFMTLEDMNVSTFKTKDPAACVSGTKIGYQGHFVLSGADNPGITHKATSLLAHHRFNIERLKTSNQQAPHGGTTLFHVEGIVNVLEPMPSGFDIKTIRDELAELGNSLNCDIALDDITDSDELGNTV
jgi:glycine cleavage system transcriptional repressor